MSHAQYFTYTTVPTAKISDHMVPHSWVLVYSHRSDVLPAVPGVYSGGPPGGDAQSRDPLAYGAAGAALAAPPTAGDPRQEEEGWRKWRGQPQ